MRKQNFTKLIAIATFALITFVGNSARAQHILFINDDTLFHTVNADTVKNDILSSMYTNMYYWSVPDSSLATPSNAMVDSFDLLIWYCGTNSTGLSFWSGGAAGNATLLHFAATGKPIWIIGLDLLYQLYGDSATFTSGDFTYDYMGLSKYVGQSYVNDGGIGCPEVDTIGGASPLFPARESWVSADSPLWYVGACIANPGVREIYKMGPFSYTMAGKVCMFHSLLAGHSIMSTFFEPALINTYANRVNFLQNGITYLLNTEGVKNIDPANRATLYPNPVSNELTINFDSKSPAHATICIYDALGSKEMQRPLDLNNGKSTISTVQLNSGIYFVTITDEHGSLVYSGKLIKE